MNDDERGGERQNEYDENQNSAHHAAAVVSSRLVHHPTRHVLQREEYVLPDVVVDDLVQTHDVLVYELLHDGDLALHRVVPGDRGRACGRRVQSRAYTCQ